VSEKRTTVAVIRLLANGIALNADPGISCAGCFSWKRLKSAPFLFKPVYADAADSIDSAENYLLFFLQGLIRPALAESSHPSPLSPPLPSHVTGRGRREEERGWDGKLETK
jgi:hypothetical protein